MALRNWGEVPYLPLLALSPGEMHALEQLPEKAKDLILPYVHLRPWVGSHYLINSLERLEKAYAERPIVLDLGDPEPGDDKKDRPVFGELRDLRDPSNGYDNWCSFIEEHENFIPAVQLRDVTQIGAQITRLRSFGRGVAVHIKPPMLGSVATFIESVKSDVGTGKQFCFVIDFGRQREDFILNQLKTVAIVNSLKAAFPKSYTAISASSFPEGFTDKEHQDIFERQHFDGVITQVQTDGVIYSDRGSARAEKQMGGGGTPAPRIDYAGASKWNFFRSEPVKKDDRPAAYVAQAKKAVKHKCWDKKLQVWGHQMIEKTAINAPNCIVSPQSSTAARINIHLHRQLYYNDPSGLYDTDEEWSDD